MSEQPVRWLVQPFSALSTDVFFDLLKLRIDVFVVEQQCAYPELDLWDRAKGTRHVMGFNRSGQLVACARLLPVDEGGSDRTANNTCWRIGRVAVSEPQRGRGVASQLMHHALEWINSQALQLGLDARVELSAQTYVVPFYLSLGFAVVSEEYLEDGIPHKDMTLDVKLSA